MKSLLYLTLESPLGCKEIQPVHPKGDQSWVFIERTYVKPETPILWPPDAKNWLIGKDPDAGKDWRWEEKGTTKNEMIGWHHWLDGHEFEQALGVGERQGSLTCYSPWVAESDMTEWLNWTVPKPSRFLCSWDSSGNNTRVGCYSLLQGIFPNQGLNLCLLCLLPWQVGSLPLAPPLKPIISHKFILLLALEKKRSLYV